MQEHMFSHVAHGREILGILGDTPPGMTLHRLQDLCKTHQDSHSRLLKKAHGHSVGGILPSEKY